MKAVTTLMCALSLVLISGCTNMTPSEQSVLSGSALGALGGAAIGALSGNAGEGAAIGAGVGAMAGAMQDTNRRAQGDYVVEEYVEEDFDEDGDGEYYVEREYHHYH